MGDASSGDGDLSNDRVQPQQGRDPENGRTPVVDALEGPASADVGLHVLPKGSVDSADTRPPTFGNLSGPVCLACLPEYKGMRIPHLHYGTCKATFVMKDMEKVGHCLACHNGWHRAHLRRGNCRYASREDSESTKKVASCSPARLTPEVGARTSAVAPPASASASPSLPLPSHNPSSSVQLLVHQGSKLGSIVASLEISLRSAIETINALNVKVDELNKKVDELTKKQDETVIDTSHDRARIDVLEQNQRASEDGPYDLDDFYATDVFDAQGENRDVTTMGANGPQIEGSQLNVKVHTPEHEEENGLPHERPPPAQLPQAPGLHDGVRLSLPSAVADLRSVGSAASGARGPGGMQPHESSHGDARRELQRQMAGGSLSSLTPTSPASLAPQGWAAQDQPAVRPPQVLPPRLLQLLRVDPTQGQRVSGTPAVHVTARVREEVPSFGRTGGGFEGPVHQGRSSSFGPSLSASVPARESAERAYCDNTGFNAGGDPGARIRDDLDVPLDASTQNMLIKQTTFLQDLPTVNSVDKNASRAEQLREWRYAVEQKMAALNPIFSEFWEWRWEVAENFYQHWLSLDAPSRATLCVSAPVPARYVWVEKFFKDKVVATLPQRLQQEYKGEHRHG